MGTKNNRQGNPDTLAGGLRGHIQSEVLVRGNAGETFCMVVQNIDSKMISTSILTCSLLSFKVHLIRDSRKGMAQDRRYNTYYKFTVFKILPLWLDS